MEGVRSDHLVAGSDYPVLLAFEKYQQNFLYIKESGIPEADANKFLHEKAQTLLGILV